jgi:methionyl-tRNA formyltransferase
MKILFAGDQVRSVPCFDAVIEAGFEVVRVLVPTAPERSANVSALVDSAARHGIPLLVTDDPNSEASIQEIIYAGAEVGVLAGFSCIVKRSFLDVLPQGCVNLHAGRLPEYRGSSPLNWALINGENTVTLSVILVNEGIDTGDVVTERQVSVGSSDTIVDLHRISNEVFPELLVEALQGIKAGNPNRRQQEGAKARYYPMRFPDDGLILWDQLTADQVHNRIRALTDPYPGAFTFRQGRKFRLLASDLAETFFIGEPGRIYRIQHGRLLVAAADRALWISRAECTDDGIPLAVVAKRYDRLLSLRDMVMDFAQGMAT